MMIECENLVKIYSLTDVEVVALQGLDLAVEEGELLGIVGASGSGKSTLLNVLGGLDRPSAGKVSIGGRDLLKMKDSELDAYRRTYPVGIPWHHDQRERLLGRTIVDVRPGDPPMLLLDDGTEVALDNTPVPTWEHGGI